MQLRPFSHQAIWQQKFASASEDPPPSDLTPLAGKSAKQGVENSLRQRFLFGEPEAVYIK